MTRARAPRRLTRGAFHVGTIVGGGCLAVAMGLEVLGRPSTPGSMLDPWLIGSGMVRLEPWAWSALGVWVVIVTPVASLVTTALEFRSIHDRRAVLATTGVLALLALSLVVGLARAA